jgi:glycosyltransferase involved in cell wall biosynthesis
MYKLLFVSNKNLSFDTRVSKLQSVLESQASGVEYVDLFCPYKSKYSKILYSNGKLLSLLAKSKGDILRGSVAYIPDLISVYKFFIFILLGGKYILDVHDYDFDRAPHGVEKYNLIYRINLLMLRFAIKRAKVVLTVSDLMSRFLCIKFGSNSKITLTLFNSYYEPECSCGENFEFSNRELSSEYKLVFVGMKSAKRGSNELLESIRQKVCEEIDFNVKISAIWFGGASEYRKNLTSRSKFVDFYEVATPLLCQACLKKGVSTSDIGIHAYRPDFANARHALPNKLFTFTNFRPRYTIFNGDMECKRVLDSHSSEADLIWLNSHADWDKTLDSIADNVVSYIRSHEIKGLKMDNGAFLELHEKASFEVLNEVNLHNLRRVIFC